MALVGITRPAVLEAVLEFDRLGRDEFLRTTGLHRARSYYLELDGRLYDSKAIAGYAHGLAQGTPLRPEDFPDGNETVATVLRTLGFEVSVRRVNWTRDELVLACALVEANGWRQVDASDPRVGELSELLRRATIHDTSVRGPDFRSPSSVALKTANIVAHHPDHTGRPTNGNRLDREVLHDFLARPAEMRQLAAALRAAITEGANQRPTRVPDLDDDATAVEGGLLHRRHLRRERDPKLRRRKIADARARGLAVACEVCGFDFAHTYGPRGTDYIEVHHRTPLHVTGPTRTTLADLALVCSNCHRMIHRTDPWLTVEQLHALVTGQRAQAL